MLVDLLYVLDYFWFMVGLGDLLIWFDLRLSIVCCLLLAVGLVGFLD